MAWTTLPNVPWPRSLTTWSASGAVLVVGKRRQGKRMPYSESLRVYHSGERCSVPLYRLWVTSRLLAFCVPALLLAVRKFMRLSNQKTATSWQAHGTVTYLLFRRNCIVLSLPFNRFRVLAAISRTIARLRWRFVGRSLTLDRGLAPLGGGYMAVR